MHHAQPYDIPFSLMTSIQDAEIQAGASHCLTSGRAGGPHLGTIDSVINHPNYLGSHTGFDV